MSARETSDAAIAHAQEAHGQPYQGIRVWSSEPGREHDMEAGQ